MSASKIINRISSLSFNSPWLIIIIFSLLGFIGIMNHAMWRDELNPWLIIRDSQNFADLITNIRYEGHPVLWYFFLAFVRRIADNPLIMQLFHLTITIASVVIFWLYSPFSYQQKFIFSFGYFPFYEYLLISRNYAFSMLFTFAFCAVFGSRKTTYLYLAILLGLLANSSAYALFVSFSLSLTLFAEFCFDSQHRREYFSQNQKYDLFLSAVVIIFSFLISIYIIIPPVDSYLHGGLEDGWLIKLDIRHFLRSIGRLFGSYFLIVPKANWLDLIITTTIALFIFMVTLIKLAKKPVAIFFYIVGNCVILTFTYLRFAGSPRHFGHFYLVFIAALWLGSYYQNSSLLINKFPIQEKLFRPFEKWHHIVLMLILYAHLLGGVSGFVKDMIIPFSASRETANYIQKSQLTEEFIVASRDANMAGLAGYLNRKLYYPELKDMGSFTLFKQGRNPVDQPEILEQIDAIFKRKVEINRILLVLNRELSFTKNNLQITPIKNFERSWVDSERYYLYWVREAGNQ